MRWSNLLRPLGTGDPRGDAFNASMVQLGEALRTDVAPPEGTPLRQAFDDSRAFFRRKFEEMTDAGVEMGWAGENYYRRIFDPCRDPG